MQPQIPKQIYLSQNIQNYELEYELKSLLPPPNPITTKIQIDYTRIHVQKKQPLMNRKQPRKRQISQDQQLNLSNFYNEQSLIFSKYDNRQLNKRNNIEYLSSIFQNNMNKLSILQKKYIGMTKIDNLLQFDSNYQSANLFRVYKTGDKQYDLILENDINSSGYAQWYNFKVKNKVKNTSIKFNIVNFYKSRTLYQKGMKPLTKIVQESTKNSSNINNDKKWQRTAYQVQYYQNDIPIQGNQQKNYHTLSFFYDFYQQNQITQFCHFYPYTYLDCQNFLLKIQDYKHIKIKNIGISNLKRTIPLIQITSDDKINLKKKVIILIGRQHSGQTQSSFIIEAFVNCLINVKDKVTEFILDKFDVYIVPILNVDGVVLGNYRTNAYGYDLNRYWHCENNLKLPEINCFKRFVYNVQKKQEIALILDLHGHNKKLNSFFFGNNLGKNPMIFPYVASTISELINFKSCTFTEQKAQKSRTARVILGNLLKDTSYFYTFQVSFWGFKKNNKVHAFSLQHLKQLAKVLISTIHKVFLEQSKQLVNSKESSYLKQIRKQLNKMDKSHFQKQQQSDQQAGQMTMKQQLQKSQQYQQVNEQKQQKKLKIFKQSRQIGIQVDMNQQQINRKNSLQKDRSNESLQKTNSKKVNLYKLIKQRKTKSFFENKTNTFNLKNKLSRNEILKDFLMDKLRINGTPLDDTNTMKNINKKQVKNTGIQTLLEQKNKKQKDFSINLNQTYHKKIIKIIDKNKTIRNQNKKVNKSQMLPSERLTNLYQFINNDRIQPNVPFIKISKKSLSHTKYHIQLQQTASKLSICKFKYSVSKQIKRKHSQRLPQI